MRYVELRRHTDNDGDALTPDGISAADGMRRGGGAEEGGGERRGGRLGWRGWFRRGKGGGL